MSFPVRGRLPGTARSKQEAGVTDAGSGDLERQALLEFLEAQRASVLAIVEGLGEEALRTPAVPSGWTPLARAP